MTNCYTEHEARVLSQLTVPLPLNELHRLEVLRETQLLDTEDSDPEFNRYTAMGRRLFEVPICLVSLVDLERQWFKSHDGLSASETHRNHAFCTYVCLPQSSDVFVVLDSHEDETFKNNVLVTGPPYVRFYAGAALLVGGVKIGSICIIDTKPWSEFTLAQKQDLQDLSSFVSTLISLRRDRAQEVTQSNFNDDMRENQRSLSLLRLTHNLKTPVANLSLAYENFLAEVMTAPSGISEATKSGIKYELSGVSTTLSFLQNVVESCLMLTKDLLFQSEVSSDPCGLYSSVVRGVHELVQKLRNIVTLLGVSFEYEDASGRGSTMCVTYPDLLLVNALGKICQMLEAIDSGMPRSVVTVKLHWSSSRQLMLVRIVCAEGALRVPTFKAIFGEVMELLSSPAEYLENNSDTVVGDQWRVLRSIGGGMALELNDVLKCASFDFWLPCTQLELQDTGTPHCSHARHFPVNRITPLKVLIVDDSTTVIETLSEFLEGRNCTVTSATNGQLGLGKLIDSISEEKTSISGNSRCLYDVVFVDLQMPVMHGGEMMSNMMRIVDESHGKNTKRENSTYNLLELAKTFDSTLFIGMLPPYSHAEDFFDEVADLKDIGFTHIIRQPLDLSHIENILAGHFPNDDDEIAVHHVKGNTRKNW
eukprot:CAMPEP_0185021098 /NCGR_PEP_ID=MMETSP1103-20130426/3754_1 /TAXON_ID=36769 /ORGANISM="Paraphysomonas bandaiensis, Strain Caron Lab Isolate" /LENGTH=647 /DNA_ID=CAMNT_0027552401 /DNA_START=117 /DNA_END=2057 /DNA_ORIENTATION=-